MPPPAAIASTSTPAAALPPAGALALRGQLRRDLPWLTLLPCALLALALGLWLALGAQRELNAQFDAEGQALARQWAELSAHSLGGAPGAPGLEAVAAAAVHGARVSRIEISHGGGVTSAGAPLTAIENLRAFSAIIEAPGAAASLGRVQLYRDTLALTHAQRRAWFGAAALTLLALALAAAALRWRTGLLPEALRRLSNTIAALQEGRFDARCAVAAQAGRAPATMHELAALAEQINRLAERLQRDRRMHDERLQQASAVALQRMAEAERAAQARVRFLAAASHDLRQPLHAMGLFIDGLRASATPSQQAVVRRLQESAEFMGLLLNDLLDISRLDAQVLTPTLRPIMLGPLFEQLAAQHADPAQQARVRLLWRGGAHAVLSDSTLLLRILGNLVGNAIRHTPAGGCVLVAVRRGHCSGGTAGLRIEVRDNGAGIAAQHHQRVFEEFYQVPATKGARGQRRGFGLGLAICARIATLLGTHIALRSQPGRGSTFSLTLPLAQQEAVEPPPVQTLPGARLTLLGLRCLVVDDDESILEATRARLQQWGCEADCVNSTASALARMRAQGACFDVVLCDLQLAGADDGMTVITAARRLQPQALTVLVSGTTSPDSLQRLSQENILLLTKPVAPAKLRALLTMRRQQQATAGAVR